MTTIKTDWNLIPRADRLALGLRLSGLHEKQQGPDLLQSNVMEPRSSTKKGKARFLMPKKIANVWQADGHPEWVSVTE